VEGRGFIGVKVVDAKVQALKSNGGKAAHSVFGGMVEGKDTGGGNDLHKMLLFCKGAGALFSSRARRRHWEKKGDSARRISLGDHFSRKTT
jgi:hypothetical protein